MSVSEAVVALPSTMVTTPLTRPTTAAAAVAGVELVTVTAVVEALPVTVTRPAVVVVFTALPATWLTLTVVPPATVIVP